jgi:hypothetical protein
VLFVKFRCGPQSDELYVDMPTISNWDIMPAAIGFSLWWEFPVRETRRKHLLNAPRMGPGKKLAAPFWRKRGLKARKTNEIVI